MRPQNLKTRIFLDSGDPSETKEALSFLGFLDGQTTNPSLIAKSPETKKRLETKGKFSKEEVCEFYRETVGKISTLIPDGSVSVEVYADATTPAETMYAEGAYMFSWIPNVHIKLPITAAGLEAARRMTREGMRVNMTLCFSQEQAAAVYAATAGARKNSVFLSPFIGRLDDIGKNGMALIENILRMYRGGDGHTETLAASIRSVEHLLASLALGCDIVTAPLAVLKIWKDAGMPVPTAAPAAPPALETIPFKELDLGKSWPSFDISHELTDRGIARFAEDWNALIG